MQRKIEYFQTEAGEMSGEFVTRSCQHPDWPHPGNEGAGEGGGGWAARHYMIQMEIDHLTSHTNQLSSDIKRGKIISIEYNQRFRKVLKVSESD